ncbi:MAG: hypothetical protein NZ898_01075 [Myxococcota bacterium]|nr:hypothetical protein [Myxococcota bacterium]MDW8360813.1 type II secretion system protein GspC [Myxococcales bacterium]
MPGVARTRVAVLITLATIALCSYFLSSAATQWLAASLIGVEIPPVGPRGDALPPPPTVQRTVDGTRILARNIFDRSSGDLTRPPPGEQEPEPASESAPAEVDPFAPPPPCEGAVRLVAAVVHAHDPDRSFAAITDATGKAMLYRRGMRVAERELVDILPSSVLLRPGSGPLCSLAMFSPQGGARPGSGPIASAATVVQERPAEVALVEPPATSSGGISEADLEAGIRQVSDTRYAVQRSLVNRLLENQAEMMRTARIIPHEEGGRVVGVKLYGIRRNSLLSRLGLQNGDMLRTINGFDMTSPDRALEAYARLRDVPHLSVAIERRGQPMTLDYDIQ